jgi:hypothetical protein
MADHRPKLGDIVRYGHRTYYYQPGGNWCYLYTNKEYIGKTSLAVFTPRTSAVRLAPRGEIPIPMEPLRLPIYNREGLEELAKKLEALSGSKK